jgi:excisionase family DNA binding protein
MTPVTIPPTLLTKDEAAAAMRVSRRKIERLIATRAIRAVKMGRHCRIPPSELERFASSLPTR